MESAGARDLEIAAICISSSMHDPRTESGPLGVWAHLGFGRQQ